MELNEDEMFEAAADALVHYGTPRHSGRYPWGSGGDPYQNSVGFKKYYNELKAKGLSDKEISDGLGLKITDHKGRPAFSTTDLRDQIALSTERIRTENINQARRLQEKNMSNIAIAERMGLGKSGESTVRGWLAASDAVREGSIRAAADQLKAEVANKNFLDVGAGTHLYMGISDTKLRRALAMIREEGYNVYSNIKGPQLGTEHLTTYKILAKPEATWHDAKDAVLNGKFGVVAAQSDDGGVTFKRPSKDGPVSVDLGRVAVKYKEDGGHQMDGVIELRRGVQDLSLEGKNYAQVRIAVNDSHYLKGMAIYSDDLPAGVDIRFNTNKSKTDPKIVADGKLGAMKPLKMADGKVDADSPFGAQTRPRLYTDKKGNQKTSPLNVVNEEGQWDEWSKSLSSQMLSKQSLSLANEQLTKAHTKRVEELGRINSMTNAVVREKLLMEFADSADAAAVHLKAAAMPRQATSVILPMNSIRPHEIYAPQFKNGEKVVLIRHPHSGPFEIPELTVNNRNPQSKRTIPGALDAVGIHYSVAAKLSGADFDGDSVLVIPNDSRKVKSRPALAGLKDFEPTVYKIPDEDTSTRRMTKKDTQKEMGKISNLITDMTIHGANDDELARAVRHSMVVIDAEKHGLNYKKSEADNNIKQLKDLYQGAPNAGAATIVSRSSADWRVPKRKQLSGLAGIDPKTGAKVFVDTPHTYQKPVLDKNGKPTGRFVTKESMTKGKRMEFVDDARRLLSGGDETSKITKDRGQPMERIYADYANAMKSLANEARKSQVRLKMPTQSKAAKALYAKEVESLTQKLRLAESNAPLERRAQALGHASYKAKVDANPGLDDDAKKKAKYQALEEARTFTGANKKKIGSAESPLTDREWDAIQAGAVSKTTLRSILRNADMDRVRDLATPKPRRALTTGQLARAKQLAAMGRSVSEIAEQLDLPRSTVADNLKSG